MKKIGLTGSFSVDRYAFDKETVSKLEENLWARSLWPLVYIISDEQLHEAYVGESTNAISRMISHLSNPERKKLNRLHLITSTEFNKSATLDIESNLIKYISGDGTYKLQNGNAGLTFHFYYQKEEYSKLFVHIWDKLRSENIAGKSLQEIDNSDLFKYSPYKSLTADQYNSIIEIIDVINGDNTGSVFVEGSAGTGKTVLAIFLIKLLVTDFHTLYDRDAKDLVDEKTIIGTLKRIFPNPRVALVVPMTPLRNTLKTVFKGIKGLSAKMVIGPSEVVKDKYDILLVDEAHRLRQRKGITNYGSFDANNKKLKLGKDGTELDWIRMRSKIQILFYDSAQSIKPADIKKSDFDALLKKSKKLKLHSQLRVKSGGDYITYVDQLLNATLSPGSPAYYSENYEFLLFDTLTSLIEKLKQKEDEYKLCRLVAGYSWKWNSKKNKNTHDIEIDGIRLKWNSEFQEWIHSENAAGEVGCIHTTQGYDLNYAGVIFGEEISFDPITKEIKIIESNYFDKKGRFGIKDSEELKAYIINIYKTLMYRGIHGTFVYACDNNLREYFMNYIPLFREKKTINIVPISQSMPEGNFVPFYDISPAAGGFSNLQEGAVTAWIELPNSISAKNDYFVCKVIGESMNKQIPNGSYCLFQKYSGGSREGKIVLVEHYKIQDADFGANYTVKLYHSEKVIHEESWSHSRIILKPLSSDAAFKNIILQDDELSSLKVLGVFVSVLATQA